MKFSTLQCKTVLAIIPDSNAQFVGKGRVPEKKPVFFIIFYWEKEGLYQRTKKLNFGMGPNVKLVSLICGLISERRKGGKFLYP